MASRDIKDLHPELQKRWLAALKEWRRLHPSEPEPFLTQTYRSPQEQDALYAQGRTKGGPKVTNARGGQSLHNYYPSLAFDISFRKDGQIDWSPSLFDRFAVIAKENGLAWGGDWKTIKDRPHFEPPNYDWKKAKAGTPPTFST